MMFIFNYNDKIKQNKITYLTDIEYSNIDGVSLQLDLAYPTESAGSFPALIYIHGGGWKEGNRSDYSSAIKDAAARGYVAITMSYRLTDINDSTGKVKYPWPAAIYDVKACIRYLRLNSKYYHIDPDKIGVTGASAGGHLSLLAGMTDFNDQLEGYINQEQRKISTRVQAVVNIAGPTDMKKLYYSAPIVTHYLISFFGGTPETHEHLFEQASPLIYYDKNDPPILTIHGQLDEVVPVEQALLLEAKAKKIQGSHTLAIQKDKGHNTGEITQTLVLNFFDFHLKNKKSANMSDLN